MPLLSKIISFWHTLLRKARVEQELDEEMRSCIEMLTEGKVEAGATREEARRTALIEFGGLDQVKEQVRDARVGAFVETLWQDLRYGARALARTPGFTAVAILSLALGIGLNTAIFSTINAVLLRPLPYKDPERLVSVEQIRLAGPPYVPTVGGSGVAPANYLDWKEQNKVFEAMAIYERLYGFFIMSTEAETTQVRGQRVSASFFPLLGMPPALGRTFLDEEDKPGANVAVLSHGLWQRHFNSDPNVLGRDITLNQASYRVVGVMPEGSRYFLEYGFDAEYQASFEAVDLWLSYPFETNAPTNRGFYTLSVIARLKPKVTLEQARLEMELIAQRLERKYPKENEGRGVWLGPLHEAVLGQRRSSLRLVWGAVGLVLLIACVNVANLLLARAAVRKREITIRSAMGVSRRRLVRQLLTEGFLLALIGGAAGLILPGRVTRFEETGLDFRVLIFALVATLVTGVLFGLVPALHGSKVQISSVLAEGGRAAMRGRTEMRLQRILVALQVGLSLVLLTGAGLMVNSFWRLHQIHLGFNPGNLLVLRSIWLMVPPVIREVGLTDDAFTQVKHHTLNPEAMRLPEQVVQRLKTLPGVKCAAVGYAFPMVRTIGYAFRVEGRPEPAPQEAEKMSAQGFPVSSSYFRTLGIRLSQGRDFDDRDTQNAPSVAIINQAMAREFWPDEPNVMGKRIIWDEPKRTAEIVGVVEDVRSWPTQPSVPHFYVPLSQSWSSSHPYFNFSRWKYVTFAIRTNSNPTALATVARKTVNEVDKNQRVEWIGTMDEVITRRFEPFRATMLLFGLFAGLAMLLSAIGIYGVISYAVTERTHEIGVRMALGARPGEVLRMIMKGGFVVTLAGILLGSIATYWLTQLISSYLFEVKPTDPLTFVCVAIVLMGVAMVACYLPARRSARQDPTVALRCD